MAEWKRRVATTAELYEAAMSNTGRSPSNDDALELRKRQAQLTHLALHRRVRAKPQGLIEFVREVIDRNDMVWTLWGNSGDGFHWDVVKGRTMLATGALQGPGGWGRYREATILVPDEVASQLILASYGEGTATPNRFGIRGVALSISLPSERRNPGRYSVIAATEPL